MNIEERFYSKYAAEWSRRKLKLPDEEDRVVIAAALAKGHDLHMFKRLDLPRVKKVIGILKGLQPQSLLDVGCGKGVFLWPLIETLPDLAVTALDVKLEHVGRVNNACAGRYPMVTAHAYDVERTPMGDRPEADAVTLLEVLEADVVTLLEVLEHTKEPQKVLNKVIKKAKQWLIITVPSKPDNNPEHHHFFTKDILQEMLMEAGAQKVTFDGVPNHLIALVSVKDG